MDLSSRHNELARAIFNLVASQQLELEDAIRAVVVLEGERPERSFAAGERYTAGNVGVGAGGAGNRSEILIRNPPDSGQLFTLLQLTTQLETTIGFVDGTALPANFGAALNVNHVADRRWGSGGPRVATTVHIKTVGVPTAVRELGRLYDLGGGAAALGNRPFIAIVPPGAQVAIAALIDNQLFSASWFGREVPLTKGVLG